MRYDVLFADASIVANCAATLGSRLSSTSLSRRKVMSERNGDKSRFHRVRKQNIQRRKRTFELLQAAAINNGEALERKRMSTAPMKDAHEYAIIHIVCITQR